MCAFQHTYPPTHHTKPPGPPHKQQEMVDRPPALGPLSPAAAAALLRAANVGVAPAGALDPNAENAAGAATFVAAGGGAAPGGAAPGGGSSAPASGPALAQVRLEGNPRTRLQFRVTVASADAALAAALKDALALLIRTAPAPAPAATA